MKLRFVVAALCACGFAASVRAWTPISPRRPVYRNFPVEFELNRAASDDLPLALAEPQVRQGLEDWARVACTALRVSYIAPTDRTPSSNDRYNTIGWVESNWSMDSSVIGFAGPTYSGTTIINSDMSLNGRDYTWITGPGSGRRVNTYSIVLHEGGHFLGLGHSSERTAAMAPSYSGGVSSLSADDQMGICALYPGAGDNDCRMSGCPTGQECSTTTNRCVDRVSDGTTCSPCARNSQCQNGVCIQYPDGATYCATNCGGTSGCGTDTCVSVSGSLVCMRMSRGRADCGVPPARCTSDSQCSAIQRCDPATGACVARPNDVPLGQVCTSSDTCGTTGFCLAGRCSQPCEWLTPSSCPTGFYCTGKRTGICSDGYCVAGAVGTRPQSATCTADTECQSLFCADGFCSTPCDPNGANTCPGGTVCSADNTSTCGSCRLSASLGDACASNEACSSRLCVPANPALANGERYCSRICEDDGSTCPRDFTCTDRVDRSICVAQRSGLGISCTANDQCRSGICTAGAMRFCTRFATTAEPCPIGFEAAAVQGSTQMVCALIQPPGCGCRTLGRSRASMAGALATLIALFCVHARRRSIRLSVRNTRVLR